LKRTKFFYGWIVVLSCTLLAFSINAMGNNTLSFYVTSISDTFHVNRATTNFMFFTMGLITRTILGLFFGRLAVRFGVKRLMIVGMGFVLAGFLAYTYADGIWMIGLGSALYGIAHAIGTLSSYNVIINNWFTKNKGLMLAIINTAVGFGGMVINPLVSTWIERVGWNQSFLNTAILMAAIAIPALAFIREKPKNNAAEPALPAANAAASQAAPEHTFRRMFRETRFWLLVAVQLLIGFAIGPCFSNAIPALRALGVNPVLVSNVLSMLLALGIVIGHMTTGLLFDRFGLVALMNTAVGIVGVGLVCMGFLTADSPGVLLVFTVLCVGYSNVLSLGTLSHMINDVFAMQQKDFSALFGFLFAVQNIGIMVGSPVSGMIFDHTGSYGIAYWLSAGLIVLMLALLRIALRLARKTADTAVSAE
jgi:MFS family permease